MKQDNNLRLDVDLDILQKNRMRPEPRIPESQSQSRHCPHGKLCWRCRLGQRLINLGHSLTGKDEG